MAMDRNLIDYLPDVLRDYREFNAVVTAQQPEFELVWAAVNSLLAEQFVHTANSFGLARWEQMLGISSKGSDSSEDRRFRILARLNDKLPYTWRALKAKLTSLAGEDYSLSWQDYAISLEVGAALLAEGKLPELKQLVEAYVPANMLVGLSVAEECSFAAYGGAACCGQMLEAGAVAEIF